MATSVSAPRVTADATAPAGKAVSVSPSNVTQLPTTRALYIGVSGDVHVSMAAGDDITFKNVPIGILPVQVNMVFADTAAQQIIALY